ncbi:hypothetical protein SLEP1_g11575 [Rubroshorea leprosula]|nr:hypothetical protein SLEP1_g11575 [Rubroshorea leprosula]
MERPKGISGVQSSGGDDTVRSSANERIEGGRQRVTGRGMSQVPTYLKADTFFLAFTEVKILWLVLMLFCKPDLLLDVTIQFRIKEKEEKETRIKKKKEKEGEFR